ncbi:MAG: adenylate/guanylate cyclase domain-containing protein [Limnohabitans sp.]
MGVSLDDDGVARRLSPVVLGPAGPMATLSMAMLTCAGVAFEDHAHFGWRALERSPTWRLPFVRSVDSFVSLEASAVLAGAVDPELVRGKFVLIGSSAVGLSDHVTTPLQVLTPGVLIHAQALAWLLDHGSPLPWDVGRWMSLLWAVVWALLVLWTWGLGRTLGVWLAWFCGTTLWLGVLIGCAQAGLFVWPFLAVALPFLMATGLSLLDWRSSLALRQQALLVLSRFVAAPVLSQILQMGLRETLTPRLREITVMIVDMRNFTQMSASLSLHDSAQLCREFLELISSPVMGMSGTLDRYSGDGLVAFWGAPLDQPDHARMALECAEVLRTDLARWNSLRQQQGRPLVGMRIGLASGKVLVGDFGSSHRSAFTAIGNCFNLASRLQELGRELHCDLVVDASTVRLSGCVLESLGQVKIKGLREAVEVFTRRSSF